MKRSKNVRLLALGTVAAAILLGCGHHYDDQKNCVDDKGIVVPDSECQQLPGTPGYHPFFHWYYGGNSLFRTGSRVSGGSTMASPGRSYFSPSSPHFSTPNLVSRGGFGTSAKSGGFSAGT